eukprot:360853-Chlamydomonas_euryale.AAC.1
MAATVAWADGTSTCVRACAAPRRRHRCPQPTQDLLAQPAAVCANVRTPAPATATAGTTAGSPATIRGSCGTAVCILEAVQPGDPPAASRQLGVLARCHQLRCQAGEAHAPLMHAHGTGKTSAAAHTPDVSYGLGQSSLQENAEKRASTQLSPAGALLLVECIQASALESAASNAVYVSVEPVDAAHRCHPSSMHATQHPSHTPTELARKQ